MRAATIIYKTGKVVKLDHVNIDLFLNELQYLVGSNYLTIESDLVKRVIFNLNESGLADIFETGWSTLNNEFIQLIVDKPIALLKRTKKSIKSADGFGNQAEFRSAESFFITIGSKVSEVLKLKKSLNSFPEFTSEIVNFIKLNQMRGHKEADLKILIEYCNTLK
ncbi:MAG: hypothetical protein U5K54_26010 [Cytophagales bacterium]|nr:hypothetical protein [Cytophagales bacterium]